MFFLHIIEKLCNLPEWLAWTLYRDSVESDTFIERDFVEELF